MARKLPPDSKGKHTGFPYAIFWEEFGEIWESLDNRPEVEGTYESLAAQLNSRGLNDRAYPNFDAVRSAVKPLGLECGAAEGLSSRLYRIAAAYLVPQLKIALGQGAAESARRVKRLARQANDLVSTLGETSMDLEVLLGIIRSQIDPSATPLFDFKSLVRELEALSASAVACADEIPRMPRGTSVSVLEARLMEAATQAIGEVSNIELEVRQADSAGRNPRPGSSSAEVLFRYLDLVEPTMTDTTKVRLFRKFSRAWISVSRKEVEADIPPRKWRSRTGRRELGYPP